MATKAEIADVLEKAADLYESEQVEWCRGTWGMSKADGTITACASSALGLAAGIRQQAVGMLETVVETGMIADIGLTEPEQLYLDVRKHVDAALNWRLPAWNDHFIARTLPVLYDPPQVPARTKEQVIELFKGLAKDLRNEE